MAPASIVRKRRPSTDVTVAVRASVACTAARSAVAETLCSATACRRSSATQFRATDDPAHCAGRRCASREVCGHTRRVAPPPICHRRPWRTPRHQRAQCASGTPCQARRRRPVEQTSVEEARSHFVATCRRGRPEPGGQRQVPRLPSQPDPAWQAALLAAREPPPVQGLQPHRAGARPHCWMARGAASRRSSMESADDAAFCVASSPSSACRCCAGATAGTATIGRSVRGGSRGLRSHTGFRHRLVLRSSGLSRGGRRRFGRSHQPAARHRHPDRERGGSRRHWHEPPRAETTSPPGLRADI